MSVAQFGIWMSFTIWILLLTFSMVKLCRYHQEENLRVSMAKVSLIDKLHSSVFPKVAFKMVNTYWCTLKPRFVFLQERKRLLNEDLVSEVPVNTSYHDRSRRSRRNHGGSGSERNQGTDNQEEHFQEVTNEVSTFLQKKMFYLLNMYWRYILK